MAYIKYKELTKYFNFNKIIEIDDLPEYVTDYIYSDEKILEAYKTSRDKEYRITTQPLESVTYFLHMKDNLVTGTYKLVYKLYDGDAYVGEAYEYLIIK